MIHPISTPIYYTGDRANESGNGLIIDMQNNLYKIKVSDSIFYITDTELSTPSASPAKRFFLKSEYEAERQAKINKFNQLIK